MKVKVKNVQGHTDYSQETLDYVQEAAEFAFRKLGIKDDHTVTIGLVDKINPVSDCETDDKYETSGIHYDLNDFSLIYVVMKDRPHILYLNTLFHEMTHAKQFSKKELMSWMGSPLWKGEPVEKVTSHEEYKNCPWEIEAREKASKILVDWTIYRAKWWLKNLWFAIGAVISIMAM